MATKRPSSGQSCCTVEELAKPAGSPPKHKPTALLGRQGHRAKRWGQGERRHGHNEKRLDQEEKRRGQEGVISKRRGQEDKQEGVTVKTTCSSGKRRWDKKHYCVFCRRPQVKISRHLLRKHTDQQEVATASILPTGSRQRHLLLEQLRCRGNYVHNIEVIRQGRGEIVPWRQPSEEVEARNYLPCPLCLGFFLRADLWKHQAACRKKITSDPSKAPNLIMELTSDLSGGFTENTLSDPTRHMIEKIKVKTPMTSVPSGNHCVSVPGMDQNITSDPCADRPRKRSRIQAAASRLLPISSGASESCSEVLHRMNQDQVSHQVKSDWLICKYGNKLIAAEDGSRRRYDYVSQKLREIGRLLLAAKCVDSTVQTLQDLLAPGHLSLVLDAARKASGSRWSRPPLAVKTTLKMVCEISMAASLHDGDWDAASRTTDFYHLLGKEWDHLDPVVPDTGSTQSFHRLQTSMTLPESPLPLSVSGGSSCGADVGGTAGGRMVSDLSVSAVPKRIQRRPWSSSEKEAVWRQLGVHVLVQSVPGKDLCQRCLDLEPDLRGRHWKDIKNQIHNQIQSQKKQQFHAKMDLLENREQEDQKNKKQYQNHEQENQNQKKHNCQDQVDHQENPVKEDQNQKKQQYKAQLDIEDQRDKKQQYHIQMNLQDQDHSHIQKERQCQTKLDQQDHSLIEKEQLYQMYQHNSLDQNMSLLMGTLYGPSGPNWAPRQSPLDQDPSINVKPGPQRTLGPDMDQLLTRTEWTDESLSQHYLVSKNLLKDGPSDGPPAHPHSVHTHF